MNGVPEPAEHAQALAGDAAAAGGANAADHAGAGAVAEAGAEAGPALQAAAPDRAGERIARRGRMREFQDGLMERMRVARTGVDTRINRLGVEIGEDRWLIDLQEAGELVPLGAITPVPLTHDWFLGMTNMRGNLVSVIDFARFQGGASTPLTRECRILAFAPSLSFNSAILVSRVLGLRDIAPMTVLERPDGDASTAAAVSTDASTDASIEAPAAMPATLSMASLPAAAHFAAPWAAQSWLDDQGQRWTRLDLSVVVRDPRFLNVGS
ncbi:MAG: chemotaxis protein CheW [Janthinobacterium lividum]